MEKAHVTKISENTWQFTEKFLGENVYCYLLTGSRSAMLIDTAYGFTDIAGAVSVITDLPLIVVNTHGHFDHVTGSYRFGNAYMSSKDNDLYQIHTRQKPLEELLVQIAGGGAREKTALLMLRPTLKKLLASARQEQKELETSISNIDAILGKSLKLKKDSEELLEIGSIQHLPRFFYSPYAAIPAAAEMQIRRIGEMPPFVIFLEPK